MPYNRVDAKIKFWDSDIFKCLHWNIVKKTCHLVLSLQRSLWFDFGVTIFSLNDSLHNIHSVILQLESIAVKMKVFQCFVILPCLVGSSLSKLLLSDYNLLRNKQYNLDTGVNTFIPKHHVPSHNRPYHKAPLLTTLHTTK